jgi:N-acetylmuramoyl-L-alanine amidase
MASNVFGSRRVLTALAAAVGLSLAAPLAAAPQTAEEMFQRAQARETGLAESPSADALRSVARSYEAVVLTHPKTGYADNALWQAAVLMDRAFERSSDVKDRQKAIKLLRWLAREYPNSPMVRQADARAAELEQAPSPPAAASRAAVSPPPAANPPPTQAVQQSAAVPEPPPATGSASLKAITRSDLPRGDRITIELTQEVPYTHGRVPNPDRLFFDFSSAAVAQSVAEQLRAINSPLVKSVRVGRPTNGVTRVVLDLEGKPKFSAFPLYSPFRLVVDVESTAPPPPGAPATPAAPPPSGPPPGTGARTAAPPANSPAAVPASVVASPSGTNGPPPLGPNAGPPAPVTPPPAPPPAPPPMRETSAPLPAPIAPAILGRGDYSMARQLGLRVSRIVIDAGHGGHDPGAQANGITEADLVLDIALRLERLLQQEPGVDVVLTRRNDTFVPLEGRTAIANKENADLFLSIHANSSRVTSVRGIETYFLNFAMTPDAEAVAARENATGGQSMGTLPAILNAIALNNKLDESRELATILQTSMARRLTPQNRSLRDLGVKQAPFVVLIGAQMPSVLAEISFISNKSEASLLKQPAYRQHIAQALCDAVLKYQASLKKITTQRR